MEFTGEMTDLDIVEYLNSVLLDGDIVGFEITANRFGADDAKVCMFCSEFSGAGKDLRDATIAYKKDREDKYASYHNNFIE